MSLINEALKKAQPERSGTPNMPSGPALPEMPPHQPPKRKRSYLWGFLLAVIVVGLFSAIVSTFLVYKILGEDAGKTTKTEPAVVETPVAATGQVWEKLPEAETTAEATVAQVEPQPALAAVAEASQVIPEEEVAEPEPPAAVQETPPAPPPRPNPAVWARLQELEIRGIMSGGDKVLIFDVSTGKTKSYEPGDILDGSLALKIASIESDAILFEDYGGIIHTKSF